MKYLILAILFSVNVLAQKYNLFLFGSKEPYDTSSTRYFASFNVLPATDTLDVIDAFIKGLKQDTLWTAIEEAWILGLNTSANSLLGLKAYKNATATATFTPYDGFTSGGTGYINTNFNPSTALAVGTQNSISIGLFSITDNMTTASTIFDMGCNNSTTAYVSIRARAGVDFANGRPNTGNEDCNQAISNTIGLFVASRTSATDVYSYKDNEGTLANRSAVTLPNYNIYICARNSSGTAGGYSPRTFSFAFVGKGLQPYQIIKLYNRVSIIASFMGWK